MPDDRAIFPMEPVPVAAADIDAGALEPPSPAAAAPATRPRPTPHRSKLEELLGNAKLPAIDRPRVVNALSRYGEWIQAMQELSSVGEQKIGDLVALLNDYKRTIEMDLVWDSEADFLFRQRGQLKVDNSVLEEFLPWLVDPAIIPALRTIDCFAGPASAFAAAYFQTTITAPAHTLGLQIRTKDQDFTLSRRAYLRASLNPAFPADSSESAAVWLAYLAAECKTNLDKTMFQSAVADAHDLKVALPGARYFIVCEYLDMTPISTAGTDIDEVLVLRGKRLASNKRARYSTAAGRRTHREEYLDALAATPVRESVVARFVSHLEGLLTHTDPDADDAVARGYF